MIRKSKRTIFIEATTNEEFEKALNEALKGLNDPKVQIFGKYQCAILFNELIYEEDHKTIADLFEEAGCGATCGDCPFYQEPTDKRKKYTVCNNRRIKEDSRACDSYYLGRRSDVSEIGRTDGGEAMDYGRSCEDPENGMVASIPQTQRQDSVLRS